MACRLQEIPKVGDFVEYWVAGYSVIVVRTSPTEIKAYQNSCRHRGMQLAQGCGTFHGGQIVCPFHAWRWDIDGTPAASLYGCEGFEDRVLDPDDLRLVECQVGTWAGCVYINMDLSAPPLMETLHPVPEFLDPLRIADMRVDWWKGIRLRCNWKLALEAFMEGWHVRGTHTQLIGDAGDDFPNPHDLQRSYPNGHQSLAKDPDNKASGTVKSKLGMSGAADPNTTIAYLRMINEQLATNVLHEGPLRRGVGPHQRARGLPPEVRGSDVRVERRRRHQLAGPRSRDPEPLEQPVVHVPELQAPPALREFPQLPRPPRS